MNIFLALSLHIFFFWSESLNTVLCINNPKNMDRSSTNTVTTKPSLIVTIHYMDSSLAKPNEKGRNKIKIREDTEIPDFVTTHICIKRIHTTQALDREVILRRIRQRRCANKVRSVFQLLFSYPFLSKKHDGNDDQDPDDASTAP